MSQQGKEPAARSCRKECERQTASLVVSNRLVAEAAIYRKLLFRGVSKSKPDVSLGHMP